MKRSVALLVAITLSLCFTYTVVNVMSVSATPTIYDSDYFNSSLNIASSSASIYDSGYFNGSLNIKSTTIYDSGYYNGSLNIKYPDIFDSGYFNGSLIINPSGYSNFTYSIDNMTITVNDTSTVPDITSYSYWFGDGSNVTTANATHTYELEGTYEVLHTVTNPSSVSQYNIKKVTVAQPEVPHEPPLSLEFNWINTIVLPMFGILLMFGLVFVISRYSG